MRKDPVVVYYRRADETPLAWSAFVEYRNLGPTRTTGEVARRLQKTTAQISKWIRRYNWKTRVAVYDRENEDAERKAELKAIEDMRARHIKAALLKQEIGETELTKVKKAAEANPDTLVIEPKLASTLQSEGMKEERLSRGQPNEIQQQVDSDTVDLKVLEVKELRAMQAVFLKLKPKDDSEPEDADDDIIDID